VNLAVNKVLGKDVHDLTNEDVDAIFSHVLDGFLKDLWDKKKDVTALGFIKDFALKAVDAIFGKRDVEGKREVQDVAIEELLERGIVKDAFNKFVDRIMSSAQAVNELFKSHGKQLKDLIGGHSKLLARDIVKGVLKMVASRVPGQTLDHLTEADFDDVTNELLKPGYPQDNLKDAVNLAVNKVLGKDVHDLSNEDVDAIFSHVLGGFLKDLWDNTKDVTALQFIKDLAQKAVDAIFGKRDVEDMEQQEFDEIMERSFMEVMNDIIGNANFFKEMFKQHSKELARDIIKGALKCLARRVPGDQLAHLSDADFDDVVSELIKPGNPVNNLKTAVSVAINRLLGKDVHDLTEGEIDAVISQALGGFLKELYDETKDKPLLSIIKDMGTKVIDSIFGKRDVQEFTDQELEDMIERGFHLKKKLKHFWNKHKDQIIKQAATAAINAAIAG